MRWPLFLVSLIALLSACQEPCVALAERICSCEPDQLERARCRQESIQTQQGRTVSDEEQEVCIAALDTCTCEALQRNRFELCGYARVAGDPGAGGGP